MPEKHEGARGSRIFLCHSSADKERVRDLYRRLRKTGLNPWLDEEDLLPGQEWEAEIPNAVRFSSAVIICLSRNAIEKTGYIQKEIKCALDAADERPEGTIFLIPARLEDCEVPDRLRRKQCVDLFQPNGYERLRKAIKAKLSSRKRILVIEDRPPIAHILRHRLEYLNYIVQIAEDGYEGMSMAIKSPPPDLIMLDLQLPHRDGYTVLQDLHRHEETRKIPVIVSSLFEDEWRRYASEMYQGRTPPLFVAKQASLAQLHEAVKVMLLRSDRRDLA